MRVVVRGGSWRNSEDEILKAAVMKYGKNQWARIASLLHRKSAKQCKTRWNEWLDPSIKKTEWSRDEDEKLLHMTKLMPTQWRTIAPIVGRTAAQCFERYEQLLSKAQNLDSGTEEANDMSKHRHIEMVPETKPALPDAVDMDEDELEMLSEARARLANTQGKKAKRKARERQLQESRRLSSLQRKRELLAAGINYRDKIMKKISIDYNEEIPFEKKPAAGFFDTSEENFKAPDVKFGKVTTHDLDIKYRDIEEKEEKKKNKAKMDKKREEDPLSLVDIQTKTKRSKLVLPEPIVTDSEMKSVIKLGRQNEELQNYVLSMNEEQAGNNPTDGLLVDYETTPSVNVGLQRDIRTPMQSPRILNEIVNQQRMQEQPTPLLRVENNDKSSTNSKNAQADFPKFEKTPNLLFNQVASDRLGINTPLKSANDQINSSAEETPTSQYSLASTDSQSIYTSRVKNAGLIKQILATIPEPKSEFEINIDDLSTDIDTRHPEVIASPDDLKDSDEYVRDQEEINNEELAKIKMIANSHLSDVIHRKLPRPNLINSGQWTLTHTASSENTFLKNAEDLVKQQMLYLTYMDKKYSTDNNTDPGTRIRSSELLQEKNNCEKYLETWETSNEKINSNLSDTEKDEAKKLIDDQVKEIRDQGPTRNISLEIFDQVWDECFGQLMFVPETQRFIRMAHANKKQLIDSITWQCDQLKHLMKFESKSISKLEARVGKIHGGYIRRSNKSIQNIDNFAGELEARRIESKTYSLLHDYEIKSSIPCRIENLRNLVKEQKLRQQELQATYLEEKKKLFKS